MTVNGGTLPDTSIDYLGVPAVPEQDKPFLNLEDVAAIGARVQGGELKPRTIAQHLWNSQPQVTLRGKTGPGKYAEDPFPKPDGRQGKSPWWNLDREAEIVAWFKRHPRRQVGDGIGGRPLSKTTGK